MKTFTNLAQWASKCASLSTSNRNRYYLFTIIMLLTLGAGTAWGEEVYFEGFEENHRTSGNNSYTASAKTYGDWTLIYADAATSGSPLTGTAHVIMRVAKNTTNSPSLVSKALLSDKVSISKVSWNCKGNTAQTLKVSYSTDGSNWVEKYSATLSSKANKSFTLDNVPGPIYLKFVVSVTSSTGGNRDANIDDITIEGTALSTEETYSVTLNQPSEGGTIEADKDEAAKGATVTLTATPDEGYKFGAWDVKDANNAEVTVSADGKFTMPESDVTVSASFVAKTQYTVKWNVAEGSVADTYVYEGDALGSLPTADNCSSGKVFVGWTEATSVNTDGSGITYAKSTDVPAGNKEYNAVYATEITTGGGGATKYVKATTISDGTYLIAATNGTNSYAYTGQVTGKTYGGYTSVTISDDEIATKPDAALEVTVKVTDGKFSMHDGTSYLYLSSNDNNLNFTTTEKTDWILDNGKIKNAAITASTRYLQFNSTSGSERFACYKSTQKDAYLYKKGDGSSTSYTDYSLDCGTNNTPFLTVTETAFDFGTVAQNKTATETFDVTGGYLAEDVALTISGTNASFFSVSPATITKADDVEETVTVTYAPTATGDHTATLTIKTGDITKEIALSGKVLAPGKWVLVKDIATLSAGDEIIIASAVADYAIGVAATNNYKGAAITKVGETANADASVTILTVEETGVAEAPYALKDGSKYLYAAGSDKNYLKAQATNNENGQWAITITEGVASIVAAKSENRNVMQCNPNDGSPIFACYKSASYQQLAIYRNSENVVKPVISGEADFVGSTQVTITAQSGLTVYYTTDGTDPNNTSAQYTAPFTINATTTVKAIAYDASSNASGVAEMKFTKHELVNVATAMALAKDEVAYFAEFEVVKVVAGKGNIYIKDANGHGLIYDNTLAGQLKDGDRVQGFVGISSPYNGLPEAKPVDGLKVADLTITSGVAAEPYDFTSTAIAEADINKYIVFNDVEIATAVSMSNSNKEFSLTINGSNVAFYNQFSIEKTLEAGKTYDIYGFVSIYNEKLQVYFYQALEEDEVVTKYTVTYNAGGATGEVPVDDNEYTEGAQVYLKSATSLTKEGYDYKGWKVTDEGGNEIAVSSNKFNMPASNVTVTAQWEKIVVTQRQDFSNGYWVLVTEEGQLVAGDKIVVAADDENFAMKSYESGNNIKDLAITKLGDKRFLKWTSEVGVFQLVSSGSGYTIQDVNTEEYLYAAGTGDKNYLKATDEVPTDDDAAKPYIWTISYTDGVATVKATSDNHNDLQYNKSADLFSCYASTQGKIALYKHVDNIDPTLVTPTIVENAYFSVGNNKYVQFSTGNLQYEVGTNTWSFASEQYEVIGGEAYTGSNNTNYGMNEPGYTGKLDLFGWSSDGKFGVNPSNTDDDYGYVADNFVDWGTLVNETGWSTLTKDEMNHILARTKDGKKLWALATVCNMNGLILLPDNWNTSTTLEYGYIPTDWNYTKNQFDAAAWATLEAAGAVFLPEGGSRVGGHGNRDQGGGPAEFDTHGDYFHVDNVGEMGYYWLNTQDTRTGYENYASFLILPGWNDNGTPNIENDDKALAPQVWSREKRRGNSVRLVKEVKPDYTRIDQGAGVYGTVCYPENIVWVDGATLYEVAGKEGNKVIFDEVTTPEAGMPYIFIADQEVINFFCGTEYEGTAGKHNSLQGTFTQIDPAEDNILVGNYMLVNNIIKKCGINCGLKANRAYFVADELENSLGAPTASQAPGRRRISLDVQSENTTTGIDNITNGENTTIKTIENGQLIIIRNGEKFNAMGVKL